METSKDGTQTDPDVVAGGMGEKVCRLSVLLMKMRISLHCIHDVVRIFVKAVGTLRSF